MKVIDVQSAVRMIKEHNRIMCGGFLACGATQNLVDALCQEGTKNLHLIAICTDFFDRGIGKLITNKQVKSVQTSHIGTNSSSQEQFKNSELEVEFNPQGTLLERIRATGVGLGGILTKTGIGTEVEKNKKIIEIDGEQYLLETPISADFAFVRAKKADQFGNLIYSKTARNSNPVIAMAAKTTIAEVDEIVENGVLDPEEIITPGIFVNYIVQHQKEK